MLATKLAIMPLVIVKVGTPIIVVGGEGGKSNSREGIVVIVVVLLVVFAKIFVEEMIVGRI